MTIDRMKRWLGLACLTVLLFQAGVAFAAESKEGEAKTKRVHVFIKGKVQGVGFRAFTKEQADALKLAGYVLNRPDGQVEVVIEGPADQVDKLLETLKKGPATAKVENVEVKDEPVTGDLKGFVIRQ